MNAVAAVSFVAAVSAAGAVVYLYLRHAILTVLVLCLPVLSTVFWTMYPDAAIRDLIFAAAAFGAAFLFFVAERMSRAVCDGLAPRMAMGAAVKSVALAAGLALSALLAPTLAIGGIQGLRALEPALPCLILEGSWIGVALCLAVFSPYTEEFVAAANRAREARQTLAMRLRVLSETRWALSIAGTALVLAAIGVFRLRDVRLVAHAALGAGVAGISIVVAAMTLLRDWRLVAGTGLSLGLAGLWLMAFAKTGLAVYGLSSALVALPMLILGRRWSNTLRGGSGPAEALVQILMHDAPGVIGCALFVFMLGLGWNAAAMQSVALPLAGAWIALGLFVFIAVGAGLHALLPRYRSVEEVFGKK